MDTSLSPFEPSGSGLSAERILTLSDLTLIVLCCMLVLNFLIVPLLDFARVFEIDLPQAEAGSAVAAPGEPSPNPVLSVRLRDPAAETVSERVDLALNGRPVSAEMLPRRLRQSTDPAAEHLELLGDAALTAQDLVSVLLLIEQSEVDLPGGVRMHVEETGA